MRRKCKRPVSLLETLGGISFEMAEVTPLGGACKYQLDLAPYGVAECDRSPLALELYADCFGKEITSGLSMDDFQGCSADTGNGFVSTVQLVFAAIQQINLPGRGFSGDYSIWSSRSLCAWLLETEREIKATHPSLYDALNEFAGYAYSALNMFVIPKYSIEGVAVNCAKGCGGLFGLGRIYDQFAPFLRLLQDHEQDFVWPPECPGFDVYVEKLCIPVLDFARANERYMAMMEDDIISEDKLTSYLESLCDAYDARAVLFSALN